MSSGSRWVDSCIGMASRAAFVAVGRGVLFCDDVNADLQCKLQLLQSDEFHAEQDWKTGGYFINAH